MSQRWDAVVVGGGHNGLVAAALLAKEGRAPRCSKASGRRRAAVTEEPWGPEFKVTALSYVMSLMPDAIVNGLDLARTATRCIRWARPTSACPTGGLVMGEEPADRYSTVAAFLEARRRRVGALGRVDGRHRRGARPAAHAGAPKLGSKRPSDLLDQLKVAWRLRGSTWRRPPT